MAKPPGSHLAAPGEYQENVSKLINKYPNLANADFKPWAEARRFVSPPRLVCFEFVTQSGAVDAPVATHFDGIAKIEAYLHYIAAQASAPHPARRLWILEGLHPPYGAILGRALDVDPRIWMGHQRISLWENQRNAGNLPVLPTLVAQQRGFTWSYCQLVHLNCETKSFTARCAENQRHIALTRRVRKEEGLGFDGVGIVHRKASFWSQALRNGGWNVLIIVDESVKRILTGDRKKWEVVTTVQTPTPFQGGYQDFLPFTTMQEAMQSKGPPRLSIYDDLCYYVQEHHNIMELSNHPNSSTLFLSKIIASESSLLVQYLNGVLNSLAWQLSRQNKLGILQSDWIEQRWSDLIAIQRRIGGYNDNVKGTKLSLTPSKPPSNQSQVFPSWKDSMADFQWLQTRMEQLQEDARSLVDAFSGLAGIVGNQQAISEARSVSYLNVLGTTFVPLSLIASILSLPSPYKPGASESWKYWAIGIPLVVAVYTAWFGLTLIMKKRAEWPAARIS